MAAHFSFPKLSFFSSVLLSLWLHKKLQLNSSIWILVNTMLQREGGLRIQGCELLGKAAQVKGKNWWYLLVENIWDFLMVPGTVSSQSLFSPSNCLYSYHLIPAPLTHTCLFVLLQNWGFLAFIFFFLSSSSILNLLHQLFFFEITPN